MKEWKSNVILIIGGLIVFITCLLFFTINRERTPVQWVSFIFIINAEIAAICMLMLIRRLSCKTEKTMMIIGLSVITALYIAISLFISFIFLIGNIERVSSLIVIQFILIALVLIIITLLYTFSKIASDKDKSLLQAISGVKQNCDNIALLASKEQNQNYKSRLDSIYESLKYCNNSVYVPSDDKIAVKIVEFENLLNDEGKIQEEKIEIILNEIDILIKKREIEAQNANKGGI